MHLGRHTIDTGARRSLRTRRAIADACRRVELQPLEPRRLFAGSVVINEIHYNPDIPTDLVEFVELTNPGDAPVDLSGATFTDGFAYTFPAGTSLAPGGYLVVTENVGKFQTKFGLSIPALGPFVGSLSNEGEKITLKTAGGATLDTVDYGAGFPWPTVGDAPGYSIELINPAFDNDLGGNWRSFAPSGGDTTLFPAGSTWKYQKGTAALAPTGLAWRLPGFNDAAWPSGPTPIGYDSALPMGTNLSDMRGNYSTVYFRKSVNIPNPNAFSAYRFDAFFDDGFSLWVNGAFVTNINSQAGAAYDDIANGAIENSGFQSYTIPAAYFQPGDNVIAVHLLNSGLSNSSDAFLDARLVATGSGVGPSPRARNAAFAANAAPQMRQVEHAPKQPASGQAVTITTKVTDPQGVTSVSMSYQLVDPGNYIAVEDAAYNSPANWTTVAMRDDGSNGDAIAGDGTYSYVLPAGVQTNRRLVRYRVSSTDGAGLSITAPYADDPVQNFAYYVYDGVPTWSASNVPGGPVVNYGASAMRSTAVYTLITKKQDHINSQALPGNTTGQYGGDNYLWSGTFVYDGEVYDGIHYRARGGVWRYAMGKNMWKMDFNTGHEFQAKDAYGNPYPEKWSKLNLGAVIQQGDIGDRGEHGLFETLGFQLYNLAGAPGSYTSPVQFRIVENALQDNGTPSDQYDDDFQGLYLSVEQDNGRFLNAHDLPDGNLYKMEGGNFAGTLNNQGPTQPTDGSDLRQLRDLVNSIGTTASAANEQALRDAIDLDSYFAFAAITKGIHNYDIGFGKNYFMYHNPDKGPAGGIDGQWSIVPWDLDLTWYADYSPGGGDVDPLLNAVMAQPNLAKEYHNRVRELRDLLYNPEQVGKMADEYAALVNPSGVGPTILQADRAMWDYNPIMSSGSVNPSKAGQGRFYQKGSPTQDFAGMVARLKSYVVSQSSFIDSNILNTAADPDAAAPQRATVSHPGGATFTPGTLTFNTTGFAPGTFGGAFAGMQWRLADVTAVAAGQKPNYEIHAKWESGTLPAFANSVTIPASAVEVGHRYRVRVRFLDSNGRWGHWSNVSANVSEFTVTAAANAVRDGVRVTEVNYNPVASYLGSTNADDQFFEFVELRNFGTEPANLLNSQFTAGIPMTFGNVTLLPGEYGVVVKDVAAFQSRYGTQVKILGTYGAENLNNNGERLTLVDALSQEVQNFAYDDIGVGWYPTTDGGGPTLVVANPGVVTPNLDLPANWRASLYAGGSPGAADTGPAAGAVVVNEVLAHTDEPVGGDWVELRNTTGAVMDISGWYLSDDRDNPRKYQFPAGTTIPANGFRVFTQQQHFGVAGLPGVINPFGISETGDQVFLSGIDASGNVSGYRDAVFFGATEQDKTVGRVTGVDGRTDFWHVLAPTRGAANAAPVVGPVVINELMYGPAGTKPEFVELRNVSGAPVPLYDPANPANAWKFTAGVTFTFPTGVTLPANGYALVVGVDPAAFRAQYDVPSNVQVFGPYTGALDGSGERITISRPAGVELDLSVPLIDVDTIEYGVTSPWPTSPDGTGPSLARINGTAYTNDATNWAAEAVHGSPGRLNFDAAAPLLASAGSVKEHLLSGNAPGTGSFFAVPLPLSGDYGIEPRQNGPTRLVLRFDEPVRAVSGFNVTLSSGTLAGPATVDGDTLTVNLTGAADGQVLAVTVAGLADLAGNAAASSYRLHVGVLWGDVNGNREVNVNDVNVAKIASGQVVTATNFRADLNLNAELNVNDVNIAKIRAGGTLPLGNPGGAGEAATPSATPTPTVTPTPTPTASPTPAATPPPTATPARPPVVKRTTVPARPTATATRPTTSTRVANDVLAPAATASPAAGGSARLKLKGEVD